MAGGLGLRELGGTGLKISSLGFGASPLGNVFGSVKEEDAIASVHEAAGLGINFFDVSPYYGDTLGETVLGKALKSIPIPRENYVLSTKCGRYGSGFDFSAERVTKSVDESLQRLNVTYVDLIHCHDIEFGSLDQIVTETIPALQKLKDAGKVRHIGISGLPLNAFRYVLDRVPKGSVEVVLSYCHYSLNDTSLLEIVPYLQEKGIGIISASPFSMGLLSGQTPPEWHPAPSELKVACNKAIEVCKAQGKSIAKLALQYAMRNHDIATTLVGMNSIEQVQENVKAAIEVEQGARYDEELLKEVEKVLQPVKNLTWSSGRDENN